MPVLFHQIDPGKAGAYTINHVNCLVDDSRVFTGETHESTGTFTTYVRNLFERAGFEPSGIIESDSRFYHQGIGDIHCGTNVQRVIPNSYNWWEYP
ncbi:MAG: protein-arginine deiminase family protein [Planctomycetota bacterium]|nr:protein-arginine deiminase family protein [Planctomycetota bacterium]